MKVDARVGANPVPIDLLESEVLRGQGVAWKITPLPLLVLLIQQLVVPVNMNNIYGMVPLYAFT